MNNKVAVQILKMYVADIQERNRYGSDPLGTRVDDLISVIKFLGQEVKPMSDPRRIEMALTELIKALKEESKPHETIDLTLEVEQEEDYRLRVNLMDNKRREYHYHDMPMRSENVREFLDARRAGNV